MASPHNPNADIVILDPLVEIELGQLGVEPPASEMTTREAMRFAFAVMQLSHAAHDVTKRHDSTQDESIKMRCQKAQRLAEGLGDIALDLISQHLDAYRAYEQEFAAECGLK